LASAPSPAPRKLSFRYVQHDRPPETLLDFLARRFRYHTEADWRRLVAAGHVTLDGRAVAPEERLRSKQLVEYIPPLMPEPEVDARYDVLFEDEHLLAVSKSGNIPTSPSGKYWHNCLRHVLQRERGLPGLQSVHRLDRETSGVNLFAKTPEAGRRLGEAFQRGQVEKRYSAVLRGHLPVREVIVSGPLQDAGGEIHIKQAVHPAGRAARTHYRLRALLPQASWVDVMPLTGRTHQIRVHAAFLGFPVWGDWLYGQSEAEFIRWVRNPQRHTLGRHLLHARELTLEHPIGGALLHLVSPDGPLLQAFLRGVSSAGAAPDREGHGPVGIDGQR
jgi:RluA family pseudouridine synthase